MTIHSDPEKGNTVEMPLTHALRVEGELRSALEEACDRTDTSPHTVLDRLIAYRHINRALDGLPVESALVERAEAILDRSGMKA